MAKHKITKRIDFCYGHRLLEHKGKCRNLHGHNGILEVDIESKELDDKGMVVDFGDVKDAIKGWVDFNFDHRMVLSKDDPIAPVLMDLNEPVYLMEVNPTAENISKHIYMIAQKQGFDVSEVRFWETPTSSATYTAK